jgi:sterol desaturase/sphingolipid hydroxylase (fatty acid hydroxylase superfamily)
VVLTSQLQHSNIRVPAWFEKIWLVFFVPPSMHRIHHSVVIRERNTNYGTILSVWDKWLGHLFQNRYKSILCEEEAYLLELTRYIHLNPLRGGVVADA